MIAVINYFAETKMQYWKEIKPYEKKSSKEDSYSPEMRIVKNFE